MMRYNQKRESLKDNKSELSAIEEYSIKTTRVAHRVLIIICIITIGYSVVTQVETVFDRAIRELDLILSLNIGPVIYKSAITENALEQLNKDYDKIEKLLSEYNLTLDRSVESSSLIEYNPSPLKIHRNSIKNIVHFFQNNNQFIVSKAIIDDDVIEGLVSILKNEHKDFQIGSRTVTVRVHSRQVSLERSPNVPPYKKGKRLKREAKFEDYYTNLDFHSIFFNSDKFKKIIDPMRPARWFMPNVQQVIKKVETIHPIEAIRILNNERKLEKGNFNAYGFIIPEKLFSIGAPVAILSLYLYFYIQLSYLYALVENNSDICMFPWEILLPNKLPLVVSQVTIFIPLLSVFAIMHTTFEDQIILQRIMTFIIVIVVFLCSCNAFSLVSRINKISKNCHSQKIDNL